MDLDLNKMLVLLAVVDRPLTPKAIDALMTERFGEKNPFRTSEPTETVHVCIAVLVAHGYLKSALWGLDLTPIGRDALLHDPLACFIAMQWMDLRSIAIRGTR